MYQIVFGRPFTDLFIFFFQVMKYQIFFVNFFLPPLPSPVSAPMFQPQQLLKTELFTWWYFNDVCVGRVQCTWSTFASRSSLFLRLCWNRINNWFHGQRASRSRPSERRREYTRLGRDIKCVYVGKFISQLRKASHLLIMIVF